MSHTSEQTVLTGIKPTGTPHIGNYFGAIEPALRRAQDFKDAYFFIADYHALNAIQSADKMRELTRSIAAVWLAAGLDPAKIHFYRQSDIPEIFEFETILNTFVPKGWMNKMHAYKAAVDVNRAAGRSDDYDVNMGLYTYPILMACDILIFNTNVVPVGRDQVQHVEIARDMAQRFNSHYQTDVLTLPQHEIKDGIAEVPGLDGRKMSKSYDNVIPLFATQAERQVAIRKIVTDSIKHTPESFKETTFYKIYATVAPTDTAANLTDELVTKMTSGAMGWKDAKDQLLEILEARFGEASQKYADLMAEPAYIDDVLAKGAASIRPQATEHLAQIKRVIGL